VAVDFSRHPSRRQPEESGGENERPLRARKNIAKGLDGSPVRVGGALEITREGEVVLKGEVNDAVGVARGVAKNVQVVEGTKLDLGTG
jgi:hypothetical protein